ncbi:MAG: hypothetical protein RL154_1329 [Pseudomonadota bacterium]|jgi:chromosome segregation ATPase
MLAQEIAQHVENKKLATFQAIDDFAYSLRSVYVDALTELEKQNLELVAAEADYAREIRHLMSANSDLLKSLEIETEDHKKSIANLQQRTAEIDGLKKELEYNRKKTVDLMDMLESLTQEVGQKKLLLDSLQEKLEKLESENEILTSKAQKFKDYVGKSASAYSQFANDDMLRRRLPPIEPQEPSTTTT